MQEKQHAKKPLSSDPLIQRRRDLVNHTNKCKKLEATGKPLPLDLAKRSTGRKIIITDNKATESRHLQRQRVKLKKEDPAKVYPPRFTSEEIRHFNMANPDGLLQFYKA
jgi:hypothetical protein